MTHPALTLALCLLVGCAAQEAPQEKNAPPEPSSPARVTTTDTTEDDVLQAVLTDERFAMYLHPDVAGRVPVVVCGPARPASVDLELFGAPVQTKARADLDADAACVEFTQLSIEGDSATAALRYPVEGVAGSFRLSRRDGRWSVDTAEVVER